MGTGLPLVLVGAALFNSLFGRLWLLWVLGTFFIATGLIAMLMGVLPTDRRAIRIAACFVAVTCALVGVANLPTLIAMHSCKRRTGEVREFMDGRVPCFAYLILAAVGYYPTLVVALLGTTLSLYGSLRMRPRELLDVLWFIVSRSMAAASITAFSTFLVLIWIGCAYDGWGDPAYVKDVLFFTSASLLMGLGAAPTCPSTFRQHIQAWLMSRGEGVQGAAVIAGLIGKRDVGKVLEMTGERFRAIRCDRLTEEIMSDNVPNPELYKLSVPAKLGEVDAFVSHSWSDDVTSPAD